MPYARDAPASVSMVAGEIRDRPTFEFRARRPRRHFGFAQHAIIENHVGSKIGNSRSGGERVIGNVENPARIGTFA